MPADNRVQAYLNSVRRRWRLAITARGVAYTCVAALALTVVTVLLANALRFSDGSVIFSRALLFAATVAAIAIFLVHPLRKRLSDERLARFVEERNPSLQDRLVTAVELEEKSKYDPTARAFGAMISRDVLARTASVPMDALIEKKKISRPVVWGVLSIVILFALSLFGPGFFQYGSKLIWLGWAKEKSDPMYRMNLVPGDVTIGRNTDQEITASPVGFLPDGVRLFVLNQGGTNWESASMLPEEKNGNYRFLLMNVKSPLEYYAESNGVRSPHYKVSVIDVPHVQKLEIRYHYPAYSGMKDSVESPGGDIVALKGTAVTLVAHTDIAASGGKMVMDDGTTVDMRQSGEKELTATFSLAKDALYHLKLQDHQKREAKASDDYVIQALLDAPPTLKLDRPGHDMQPSPIEEVVIGMEAEDDVRMKSLELHYSVNGSPEKTVALSSDAKQQLAGTHTIALEDYKMVPGDLVSFYGVAKDANSTVTKSDMFFLQVRPFERNYTQSQQGGGGGGQQGQENTFLSEKEKQIVAATWNVIRRKAEQTPDQLTAQSKALTEIQNTLQEQAVTMASRTEGRELTQVNGEFQSLAENLKEAAKSMGEASKLLEKKGFESALTPEQTALQHLLRAESTYRDIQVAMGGGGGGGGGGAAQDLSELFALELDTGKNQYESLQQMNDKNAHASMEEMMKKLEELARRQENLTKQEDRKESMRAANRWEQEMLRREAEELKRQMEQLAQQSKSSQLQQASNRLEQAIRDMQEASRKEGQQQGQQNGQQSGQQGQQSGQQGQSSGQQGRGGQSGQQGASGEMQQASGGGSGQSERERAAQRLREASNMISGAQQQSNEEALNRLAERADELAKQQQGIAQESRRVAGNQKPGDSGQGRAPTGAEREALERIIDSKVEQLDALNQFKQQIGEAASRMAATQRKTAQKLREATSTIQDERFEDKIRQGAYMEQRGLWPLAMPAEENLAEDMQKLAQRMKEARDGFGGEKGDDKLQQALNMAERVRQGLEGLGQDPHGAGDQKNGQNGQGRDGQRLARNGQGNEPGNERGMNGQQGSQSGQQGSQQGQSGQQGSQSGQSGQQGSQGGQSGQMGGQGQSSGQSNGQSNGQANGMQGSVGRGSMRGGESSGAGAGTYQAGTYGWNGGYNRPLTEEEARALDRDFEELVRQAVGLQSLVSEDPIISKLARDLAAGMRNMDAKEFVKEEGSRKAQNMIDQWKEMELRLGRKVQGDQADPVKLAGQERVPEKYRGILEEYYRSLSKSAK